MNFRSYCIGLAVGTLLGIALTMAVVRLRDAVRCPEAVGGANAAPAALQEQETASGEAVYITL